MKKILLAVVTVATALGFWLLLKPIFGQSFPEARNWVWPLATLAVFSGLTGLTFLLFDRKTVWLVISLNLVIFALVFNPKEITVWAGVGMALLFQLSARQAIRGESQNRLKFKLSSTLHSGMGRLITSILILISFAYFLNSGIREAAERQELPGPVHQAVRVVVGSYIRENLERQNPSLRAQATQTVLNQITNFLKPYFVFVPPVLVFGLFLILQGLSFIFVWLGILLAMLIFRILKILKLVTIEKEQKEVEILNF